MNSLWGINMLSFLCGGCGINGGSHNTCQEARLDSLEPSPVINAEYGQIRTGNGRSRKSTVRKISRIYLM